MRRPDDTPAPRPPAAAFPGLTEAQRAALSDAAAAALAGTVRSASGSGAPDLEARVRYLAQRHGYALRRSRTRDPRGPDFGAYYFVDPRTNARVGPGGRDGLCLKEAEEWLATRGPARPPGAAAARVRPCAAPPPTAAIACARRRRARGHGAGASPGAGVVAGGAGAAHRRAGRADAPSGRLQAGGGPCRPAPPAARPRRGAGPAGLRGVGPRRAAAPRLADGARVDRPSGAWHALADRQ